MGISSAFASFSGIWLMPSLSLAAPKRLRERERARLLFFLCPAISTPPQFRPLLLHPFNSPAQASTEEASP